MPEYTGTRLNDEIKISRLYTVHYFEYSKRFSFTGESHDFWELVYADKGDVTVFADDKSFVLEQGNVIFHKPNEWHNVRANGVDAANITIITFASPSKAMSFFENKILSVGQKQKELLSKIVSEYTNAFNIIYCYPVRYIRVYIYFHTPCAVKIRIADVCDLVRKSFADKARAARKARCVGIRRRQNLFQ